MARKSGFSSNDLQRIKEGRLMIDGEEMDVFAALLDINVTELLEQRDEAEYREF